MHDCDYYEYDTFAQDISVEQNEEMKRDYGLQKCLGLEECRLVMHVFYAHQVWNAGPSMTDSATYRLSCISCMTRDSRSCW